MAENEQPAQPKQEGIISLIVKDQHGGEVMFKVKHHTKLGKVMEKYCEKKGITLDSVKFLFDGERIKDDDTPQGLDMADNDSIDVVVTQVGGSSQ